MIRGASFGALDKSPREEPEYFTPNGLIFRATRIIFFWEYPEYTKFCGWTQPWPLIDWICCFGPRKRWKKKQSKIECKNQIDHLRKYFVSPPFNTNYTERRKNRNPREVTGGSDWSIVRMNIWMCSRAGIWRNPRRVLQWRIWIFGTTAEFVNVEYDSQEVGEQRPWWLCSENYTNTYNYNEKYKPWWWIFSGVEIGTRWKDGRYARVIVRAATSGSCQI